VLANFQEKRTEKNYPADPWYMPSLVAVMEARNCRHTQSNIFQADAPENRDGESVADETFVYIKNISEFNLLDMQNTLRKFAYDPCAACIC
jgi:hypothetical protein